MRQRHTRPVFRGDPAPLTTECINKLTTIPGESNFNEDTLNLVRSIASVGNDDLWP
jgi:hypothetical protein